MLCHDMTMLCYAMIVAFWTGTAAIKTVDLDAYLNGCATHHREVCAHESDEFLEVARLGPLRGRVCAYEVRSSLKP